MIHFIHGEDTFRSIENLNSIKDKFTVETNNQADYFILDYEENVNQKHMGDFVSSSGLFTEKQLIILKNCLNLAGSDTLNEIHGYLKNNPSLKNEKATQIIFWEKNKPKKNTRLYKLLTQIANLKEYSRLEGDKLGNWIKKRFQKYNSQINIESEVIPLLAANLKNDLFVLDNEIQKLINYSQNNSITTDSINQVVSFQTHSNIFKTIESLTSGNKKNALKLLHNQLDSGTDPFYILSMYIYQIRNLIKISDYYFKGLTNQYELARAAKVHPFVAKKASESLHKLSKDKLFKVYKNLQNIDYKIKTGKISIETALDIFVINF